MSSGAMSLKAKIRNYAKKNGIAAQVVLQNYMFERFLVRLSRSEYRDKFVIKGGVLIAAIVGLDTRSTMDIDTTLRGLPFVDEKISQTVGKSINQMSLEIGFTKGYLSRIISGERNPNDRLVSLLCTKYNVSETWLRTGEGEMFSTPESDIDVAMRVIADRVKRLAPDLQQEVYGLCRRILDQSAEPSSAKPKKTKKPASKTPKNK